MDAYNDAAHRALYVLNQRFLYDEIEAELNLVFDQLVFLASDYAYSHHKNNAASLSLDETYVDRLRHTRKAHRKLVEPPARRLGIPLAQRRVQLLGRVIDLNALIAQHINAKLYKDVEFCLRKFEASELSTVIDFARALIIVEQTRNALAEYLDLDEFDVIFAEVDESVGPSAFAGRSMMHVLGSLVNDVLPNFSYNALTRRFVRSPACLKPVDRPKAPKADHQHLGYGARCQRAYDMANKLSRGFLGIPHYVAIIQIIGTLAVPLLVNNLLTNLADRLEIAKAYLDAITEGLPPCKLPKYMYGLAGVYGVFDALLKPILRYADLKPEVFQALKEIGNTLVFIRDLSDVLNRDDLERLIHAVPYIDTNFSINEKKSLDNDSRFPLVSAVSKIETSSNDATELARLAAALHADIICDNSITPAPARRNRAPHTSLFYGAVVHLAKLIEPYRESWSSNNPTNGVMELEAATDLHRLWSALSFLFGLQPGKFETTNSKDDTDEKSGTSTAKKQTLTVSDEAQFGHGFFVAGAALIHVLGQRYRYEALDFANHVLRVQMYEASATNRASGVGKADASLNDDATGFARLKTYHKRIFDMAVAMFDAAAPDVGAPPLSIKFKPPASDADLEEITNAKRRASVVPIQRPLSTSANNGTSTPTPPPALTKKSQPPAPPKQSPKVAPPSPKQNVQNSKPPPPVKPKSSGPPPPAMPSSSGPPPPMPSSSGPPPPMPSSSGPPPPMPSSSSPPPPMPSSSGPPPPMPTSVAPQVTQVKPAPPASVKKPPAAKKPPPPKGKKPPAPPAKSSKSKAGPPAGGPRPSLPFLAGINANRVD